MMHDFLNNLNAADWVCLVVLIFSAGGGFLRGFSSEAVNLGVWLGAGWLSVRGTGTLLSFVPNIGQDISQHPGGNVTAHLAVLLLGRAALNGASNALATMGRGIVSSGVDTLLGVVFGALRGYLFLILAALIVSWASPQRLNDFMKNSLFAPSIFQGMKTLQGYLPPDIASYLEEAGRKNLSASLPFTPSDQAGSQEERPEGSQAQKRPVIQPEAKSGQNANRQDDIILPPDTDSSDVLP